MENCENCKILFVGEPNVGKSSIFYTYRYGVFGNNSRATIGTDFFVKSLTINETEIKFQIWDILLSCMHGERVQSLYKCVHGIIFVKYAEKNPKQKGESITQSPYGVPT